MADIIGTDAADNINGTSGSDTVYAKRGDDYIFTFGGDDSIVYLTGIGSTQPGAATIGDSDGADIVDGGDGTDRFLVYSDIHYALVGRNSTVLPMTFSLTAGTDGYAHFVSSQGWDQYIDGPHNGTATADVRLKNVEEFAFSGTGAAAPEFSYLVHYDTTDRIVVGDLSGTGLTGTLIFALGSDGPNWSGVDGDQLDAHAAVNQIVANGGAGNDTLIGGSAGDELIGGAGNDALTGNGGNNTLVGGAGNDRYYSDNASDTVLELAGEGSDFIYTKASFYILKDNVEVLTYVGTGDFTGMGTALDNTIGGGNGNDYLIGLDGDDWLMGGGGNNALQGGLGDDTYYTDSLGDTLIEFTGEGTDTVVTSLLSYTLKTDFENLTLSGSGSHAGTGNAIDNVITGGSGADTLSGLEGNDTLVGGSNVANTLIGGTGDDLYVVSVAGDQIVEAAGEGTDTVSVSALSFTLAANVENLENTAASWSGTVALVGNDGANSVTGGGGSDNIDGRGGNDVLRGGAGGDSLTGGQGDDRLTGGGGGDEMSGGAGADRFIFDVASSTSQDLVHDFTRAQGDKVDVSQLLAGIGYAGSDPLADGYLKLEEIAAAGSTGAPATRLLFDADGSGAGAAISLAVFLGADHTLVAGDFILTA